MPLLSYAQFTGRLQAIECFRPRIQCSLSVDVKIDVNRVPELVCYQFGVHVPFAHQR